MNQLKRMITRTISLMGIIALIAGCAGGQKTSQSETRKRLKVGFLAGSVDPFYAEMERDAKIAAEKLGIDLIFQIPKEWEPTLQTEMLNALVARGDLDFLVVVPVDTNALIEPLRRAHDSGLPIVTVDTWLGDGDYTEGPDSFVISYIGSNQLLGGQIAGQEMDKFLGGKGKVYVQNYDPSFLPTMQRENGFLEELKKNTGYEHGGTDYNQGQPENAQQQTTAFLKRVPDLNGIFATDIYATQGASLAVKNAGLDKQIVIVSMDQPTPASRELLEKGLVKAMLAQKPGEMAYLAMLFGIAYLDGATDLPKTVLTSWTVFTQEDLKDPEKAKLFEEK